MWVQGLLDVQIAEDPQVLATAPLGALAQPVRKLLPFTPGRLAGSGEGGTVGRVL
jgi:hypothetical protein